MFVDFFLELRAARVPVTLREFLDLLAALRAGVASYRVDDFYYLSRAALVKDERHLDRFDRVFAHCFKGIEDMGDLLGAGEIPEAWLTALAQRLLSEEEKARIEALGGFEALMETLKQRLAEQRERHEGGSKWIGTGGTSPFGSAGYNPEGVRMGADGSRQGRAVKVWDQRTYRNLADTVELGTRNIKLALRRLRRFAREGAASELDMPETIRATAHKGYLDLKLVPERHNAVRVLLFFDVGGSMAPFVRTCEELFSAARAEFKHMEYFYFHNCPYESLWRDNRRRREERIDTWRILHTYPAEYKVVLVGDASMSPYEIVQPGGSVEHMNPESGEIWLRRLTETYPKSVWLNPVPERHWHYTPSIDMIRMLMGGRMFPLTLAGLDAAMRTLGR